MRAARPAGPPVPSSPRAHGRPPAVPYETAVRNPNPVPSVCLRKAGATKSRSLSLRPLQNQPDYFGQTSPALCLASQLRLAFAGELIELCFAAGFRGSPIGSKKLLEFEAVQRGVERPLLHLQSLPGHLLNSLGNRVTMNRPQRNHAENQEIESALREVNLLFHLHAYAFYLYAIVI